MRRSCGFIVSVCMTLALAGCRTGQSAPAAAEAAPAAGPPPQVRFHLGSQRPLAGCYELRDEAGNLVYVAPEPALTERDIESAELYRGTRGEIIQVRFTPDAADALSRLTRTHIGWRLAILVDGVLVSAPVIGQQIDTGTAFISGNFAAGRAEQIVESLQSPQPSTDAPF